MKGKTLDELDAGVLTAAQGKEGRKIESSGSVFF